MRTPKKTAVKRHTQTSRACRVRKGGNTRYGANYNSITDDGGGLTAGGTQTPGDQRPPPSGQKGFPPFLTTPHR